MELDFTDEQLALRESVRSVLARECPPALAREVVEKGVRADRLWSRMVELGWPALTVPETQGGLGLGWVELAVVLEELGRALAPVPYLATVAQFAVAVAAADPESPFLAAVAAGRVTGALAASGVEAEPGAGGGWLLRGEARYVLDGSLATEVAVFAGGQVFVVPGADAQLTPLEPFDATRPIAHLTFGGVAVPASRVLGPADAAAVHRRCAVGVALETVGTCQAILDIALDHAKNRHQFGVPIGSFQAVKHKLADMYVALEKARATAYFAALTLAEDDPRQALAASMAKAAAGDAQRLIAQEGIQILGGMGYTWEHDMHLYVKRAKTGEALFGTTREHRAAVADLLGV